LCPGFGQVGMGSAMLKYSMRMCERERAAVNRQEIRRAAVQCTDEELTTTEAGQLIGRSLAQVARLIALGELRARRDARGWWRVEAQSAREYAERGAGPAVRAGR
jgi:hypothetical protein